MTVELAAWRRRVLEFLSKHEFETGELGYRCDVVLLGTTEAEQDAVEESIGELVALGLIDDLDAQLRLTTAGVLMSRDAPWREVGERLLAYLQRRLQKDGSRFQELSPGELVEAGVIGGAEQIGAVARLNTLFGLSAGGSRQKWWVPQDLLRLSRCRTLGEVNQLLVEEGFRNARPLPSCLSGEESEQQGDANGGRLRFDEEQVVLAGGAKVDGALRDVLSMFDPIGINDRPKGLTFLRVALIERRKCSVSVKEAAVAVRDLLSLGLLAVARNPGPRFTVDVPGFDERTLPRLPDDPEDGETCFAPTKLGAKAARLVSPIPGPTAPWRLGPERSCDQVLLACQQGSSTFAAIDAACSLLTSDETRVGLADAVRTGLLVQNGDRWELTAEGRGRAHEVSAELTVLTSSEALVAPQPGTNPFDHRILKLVGDARVANIVRRDIGELSLVLGAGGHKSVLLLCGSILEAVLLGVLDRNPGIAQSCLPKGRKRWPDDASLPVLIGMARTIKVRVGEKGVSNLLSPTVMGLLQSISDHRDLIHPRAEAREGIRVDQTTAKAMLHLADVVVRDLLAAEEEGTLKAYQEGETAD